MGHMPQRDTVFEHKYLIEEQIGEGGFAAVYRGRDITTQRLVAIKVLVQGEEHWQKGSRLRQRFEREANLLAQLTNEHTVRLLEFAESSDGALYLVFEYVDGIDLHDLLEQRGPVEPSRVRSILQQVCAALLEAHEHGVLHRDIKPANIMVYRHMNVGDLVKLLDFGIAKPIGDEAPSEGLTTAGIVLGTPRYMSPEQISGSRLDASSDIYSLGLVAFELLTGASPIEAESRSGIVREQLSPRQFEWPRSSSVPRSLRRVIDKMLAKDRHQRYQSCAEILSDLEDAADEPRKFPTRQHWIALGAVGLLAVVTLLLAALTGGDEEVEPEEVPTAVVERPVATPRPRPTPDVPAVRTTTTTTPRAALRDEEPPPNIPAEPPPDDDIQPKKTKSFAAAKSLATSAYMMNDWDRLIATCKPWAIDHSFCARMLAEAYKGKRDVERACYWYAAVGLQEHGLNCE